MKKHALTLTLILSGCTIAPIKNAQTDIQKHITIPTQWMMTPSNTATAHHADWWTNFHSTELNQLIQQGLAHNPNLTAAALNWQKARLAINHAEHNQTLTTNGNLNANTSRNLTSGNHSNQTYTAGLTTSYQLDLWQKLAATTQTAEWTANASAEDQLATKLSLEADIANAYLALLYANDQLKYNSAQIQTQQQLLNLIQTKHQAGAASQLDLTNARQNLNNLKTTRTNLQSTATQAQTTLTTLLGTAPTAYHTTNSLTQLTPPTLPTSIPADILRQRPDLRAAQYRLQADLGNIAIAERDFYPTITLNAGINTASNQLIEILRNPVGSLTANLTLPFLQHREKTLALKNNELTYQTNLANFTQTLYNALRDTQNALISLNEAEQTTPLLEQQLHDANKIVELTQIRYNAGADTLQTLLNAQENRRNIENALLTNRYNRLTRTVALYLALGGGTNTTPLNLPTQHALN